MTTSAVKMRERRLVCNIRVYAFVYMLKQNICTIIYQASSQQRVSAKTVHQDLNQLPSALSSTALNAALVVQQVSALERDDLSNQTINSEHVDASTVVAEVHAYG